MLIGRMSAQVPMNMSEINCASYISGIFGKDFVFIFRHHRIHDDVL